MHFIFTVTVLDKGLESINQNLESLLSLDRSPSMSVVESPENFTVTTFEKGLPSDYPLFILQNGRRRVTLNDNIL